MHILETAKKLVDDTKSLVSSAGGTQEQLAAAAHCAVRTITSEADHVKLGAASLTSDDMEAQLLLLNAVKDVAHALGSLVDSTRGAAGKSVQDPSMGGPQGLYQVGGGGAVGKGRGGNACMHVPHVPMCSI